MISGTVKEGTTSKVQTTVFDPFGNVTSTTITDLVYPQNFTVDGSTNHVSGVTYDGAGNVTSWGDFTYSYDGLGSLQTVSNTSGENHTYLYTAAGERISDRDNQSGVTTVTVRDLQGKVLRIFTKTPGTGTWSWIKDYVYRDGALLATVDASPSETRHFHLDHLGSPRLITNGSATTVATHTYYPFGLETSGSTDDDERMKFTGHEREPYNHDYMHARHYHPATLRFLTPDLLRGDPHRPQTFNLFAYVGGNPISYVDPFGLEDEEPPEVPPIIYIVPGREYVVTADTPWLPWLMLRSLLWSPSRSGGGVPVPVPAPLPSPGDMLRTVVGELLCPKTAQGITLDASTVNPLTSGGGGIYGLNLQYVPGHGLALYGLHTPNREGSFGLDLGIAATVNQAIGGGPWAGRFDSATGSYLLGTGAAFWSPDGDLSSGWYGVQDGVTFGLPVGLGLARTEYDKMIDFSFLMPWCD